MTVLKRILLHVIPNLEGGGAERQLCMLASEQAKKGISVHVACRRGGVYEQPLRNADVHVHFLGDHRNISPLLVIKICNLIKRIRPSIVQTWLPQMDVVGGIAASCMSVPWILSERVSRLPNPCFSLAFVLRVRSLVGKSAKAVVSNSAVGVEYWKRTLGSNGRIFLIGNAVDVAAIRNAASVNIESAILSRCKCILVVGRLAPQKAIDTVIKAVRLIPLTLRLSVLIIGEGPLREEIEASIRDADIKDRISLLPYRQDWWGLLKSASALVNMSRFEGQPNVVLEAMAAGCPLIVSDIPEHREFLDENSAILVPLDNSSELAEAIISLLGAPESAHKRAERAFSYVNRMTIQLTTDAYESVYDKVLSGREG